MSASSKKTTKREKKENLSAILTKLHKIVDWFEDNEHLDLEEGIQKMKEGAEYLKIARTELKEIDNQFKEVEKSLHD